MTARTAERWIGPTAIAALVVLAGVSGVAAAGSAPAPVAAQDGLQSEVDAHHTLDGQIAAAAQNETNGGNATTTDGNATTTGDNATTTGDNATTTTTDAGLDDATGPDANETVELNATNLPDYTPTVFRDVDGAVATEDGRVTVAGRAPGLEEVLVVVIDGRGRIASEILPVSRTDVFREEDLDLVTPDGEDLAEGPIVAAVFGLGSDGVVGDGVVPGADEADLEALDAWARDEAETVSGDETDAETALDVLDLYYEQSVDDAGSDDVALVDGFQYTAGRTVVEAVGPSAAENVTGSQPVPVGETAVVRGQTNRKPDDTVIAVTAVEGPSPQAFAIETTDDWRTDGVWTVELDTSGVEPGTYTLESDDGDVTDQIELEVVPAGGGGNATNSTAIGTDPAVQGSDVRADSERQATASR